MNRRLLYLVLTRLSESISEAKELQEGMARFKLKKVDLGKNKFR
jgi:hypothetical protein